MLVSSVPLSWREGWPFACFGNLPSPCLHAPGKVNEAPGSRAPLTSDISLNRVAGSNRMVTHAGICRARNHQAAGDRKRNANPKSNARIVH